MFFVVESLRFDRSSLVGVACSIVSFRFILTLFDALGKLYSVKSGLLWASYMYIIEMAEYWHVAFTGNFLCMFESKI